MGQSIAETIEKTLERRAFLRKATSVAAAFIGGMFGASKLAYACYECCSLCRVPTTECDWGACACKWCWTCTNGCIIISCQECLMTPFKLPCEANNCTCGTGVRGNDPCRYCDPNYIPCSWAKAIGHLPPPCISP